MSGKITKENAGKFLLAALIRAVKTVAQTGAAMISPAMAGAVGGGGLGSIAIRYGYNRWQPHILWPSVIILVLLVQLFQILGMKISKNLDRRRT